MKHHKPFVKILVISLAMAVILQATSCGYFMYPERRGQRSGRIDPGVAILDAVGLLFFIIPGVVAFAVDISNGTIYLPSGRRSSLKPSNQLEMLAIRIPPEKLNKDGIEAIVGEHIGKTVSLDSENVRIYRLDDMEQVRLEYKEFLAKG